MWFASHVLHFMTHKISICIEDDVDMKQAEPMRITNALTWDI